MADALDVNGRLIACFQLVFPDLGVNEITRADYRALDEWDSLASISLVAVIEEEFDITIDDDVIEKLTNYSAIHAMLST